MENSKKINNSTKTSQKKLPKKEKNDSNKNQSEQQANLTQKEKNESSKNATLLLSQKRTYLAGTRTCLAFIRTALSCLAVAFAFMKLDKEHPIDAFTIILFIVAGITIFGAVLTIIHTKLYVEKFDNN